MATQPAGMLSLTYHLAFDDYYRDLWMRGDYLKCFEDFGISDPGLRQRIRAVNNKLGTADAAQRDALVDQWMGMVGDDVKTSAANPKILW